MLISLPNDIHICLIIKSLIRAEPPVTCIIKANAGDRGKCVGSFTKVKLGVFACLLDRPTRGKSEFYEGEPYGK